MTNKTILEGRFSLSGKDVSNKFEVREIKNSKTKERIQRVREKKGRGGGPRTI